MKRATQLGLMIAVLLLAVPGASIAQDAHIVPTHLDFGAVCVDGAVTGDITITSGIVGDLRIFWVDFLVGDNPSGAFSRDILDPIGDPMPYGVFVTVAVTYNPAGLDTHDATLTVVSNDGAHPIQTVTLTGQGIACGPATAIVQQLIADIENSVIELDGIGPGSSADGRYGAFLNMLETAAALLDAGLADEACEQLESALDRVDGEGPVPDFVAGAGAADAQAEVIAALSFLGCR